ncbi:uncharacterized protein LOC107520381 isoform X3 [Rousettus aegyptiacus]|uniref:uncharacterized protein LOC107520381 isoform X3 n=1 Tax=Rousettus aegyptiacus TaxID=9407 RepID=UPI00168D5BDC|nr:uncharacterized protein LOC107520381 isoform X3 [Rousettus aegyptiacus]
MGWEGVASYLRGRWVVWGRGGDGRGELIGPLGPGAFPQARPTPTARFSPGPLGSRRPENLLFPSRRRRRFLELLCGGVPVTSSRPPCLRRGSQTSLLPLLHRWTGSPGNKMTTMSPPVVKRRQNCQEHRGTVQILQKGFKKRTKKDLGFRREEDLNLQGFRESSSGLPKRAARRTCIPPEGDRCRCETKGTACGTLPSLHFYGERRTIIASVPARSHIAIRFRGRVVEQRGRTVGALLEFPPADVVGVVVHCLQLALPHCSLGFWPPPQHTCSLPQGPRESQALLTSFQLPPLTQVPDIPLLKTAYDPDTAAQCSLPSLLFLAVSGQKENTPGQATSSLYCLIGKKRTPRPRPLRVSL